MGKASVKFNTRQFERALTQFGREAGAAGHDVIRNQLRIFITKTARLQPPKTKGAGTRTINKDVSSVLGAIENKRALLKLREFFGDRFWPLSFEPDIGPARVWANKYRNKRGRVTYKATTVTIPGPNYKFSGKMHTTKRNRNQILREKKAKVGQAKAGWVKAAARFGAQLPAWVTQHKADGDARDTFNERSGRGFVEATNKVKHAARHTGLAEAVMRGRVRAMKSDLNKRMIEIGKKHSAK